MPANDTQQRIIIVTKSDVLIDVVSVYLEGWFHAKIEVLDTSQKLEECFAEGAPKGVHLLILEDKKLLAAAQKSIVDFMAQTIVIGKEAEAAPAMGRLVAYLSAPIDLNKLSDTIQSFAESSGGPAREYCPIRQEILVLSGRELGQDVYCLHKDGKYERVFRKGERLDLTGEVFSKLIRERYFYLKVAAFSAFMKEFALDMQGISVAPVKVFNIENAINLSMSVHELLAHALPEFGLTIELQQATKAAIDLVVKSIEKDTRLGDLLKALSKNDSDYLCWHSVTICYIACRLSNLMTWHSQSTLYKLSYAAFLHDITVKSIALQRINTLEELELSEATENEKKKYIEHSHEAAALARTMKDFPGDVDHIIAQHHELPNGKGFPLGINHRKISPLASLFILAHEITDGLFDEREAFELPRAVEKLEKKFTTGYFRQIISALKALCAKGPPTGGDQ